MLNSIQVIYKYDEVCFCYELFDLDAVKVLKSSRIRTPLITEIKVSSKELKYFNCILMWESSAI